jgi:hypothetical protein
MTPPLRITKNKAALAALSRLRDALFDGRGLTRCTYRRARTIQPKRLHDERICSTILRIETARAASE